MRLGERIVQPDFMVLIGFYPVALIETVAPGHKPTAAQFERAADLAEALEIPYAFVSDGTNFWEASPDDEPELYNKFPNAQELRDRLSSQWGDKDLRLYPVTFDKQFSIEQALAVTRLTEAIMAGDQHLSVKMNTGAGKSVVTINVARILLNSGRYQHGLIVNSIEMAALQLRGRFQNLASDVTTQYIQNLTGETAPAAQLTLIPYNRNLTGNLKRGLLPKNAFDLIIIEDAIDLEFLTALTNFCPKATFISITSNFAQPNFGRLVFSYGVEEQIAIQALRPPAGYIGVALKEIADIKPGLTEIRNRQGGGSQNEKAAWVIAGRDIDADGKVDLTKLDQLKVEASEIEKYRLQPGDILVASWIPPEGSTKITLMPAAISSLDKPVVFVNRLNRLRLNGQQLQPHQVFDFLRSDNGQNLLRQFAGNKRCSNFGPGFEPASHFCARKKRGCAITRNRNRDPYAAD